MNPTPNQPAVTELRTGPRVRVLLADDHPVVRAGLVALLAREPDLCVVFEARHGGEAVEGWQSQQPDVGLIDLNMPVLDGFAAVAAIRCFAPTARLVVMTTLGGDEDVHRALQAGASGYLLKDSGPAELAACIRAVAGGQKYLHATAAARLADRLSTVDLTGRETDVLQGLAQGLSNKRIAHQIGVAEGTVKTHVKGLLGKLDASSRTQAVSLALQRGLVRLPGV
jgi:two-component system, NarL family, response regulator